MALSAAGIEFAYRPRCPVLRGVALRAEAGELLGVVGPNGSGKSTLLGCLGGLLRPSEGRVLLGEGESVPDMEPARRARLLALVPQAPSIAFSFTVLQVVLLGRTAARGVGWLEAEGDLAAARDALAFLGVEALASRRVDALSGGERQLVFLAQALAQGPSVLLLDEPTSHLDLGRRLDVLGRLADRVHAQGLVGVTVLHDLNLAAQLCDQICVLSEGRLTHRGPPAEVLIPEVIESIYGARVQVGRHPDQPVPTITPLR